MAQTNVSFEMNTKLYDEMSKLCNGLGMDPDDAFQLFAQKMVNENKIPFEVNLKDIPPKVAEEKVFHFVKLTVIVATTAAAIAVIIKLFRQLAHH